MAAGMIGNGGGRKGRYRPMAEINVTPLVDVMLVLLIIFMVAAPLMTVGVQVDLPRTAANPLSNPDEPLVVSVRADGSVILMETPIAFEELVPRLQAIAQTRGREEARVFVRGDRAANYGRIAETLTAIQQGGFSRVALQMDQATGAPPAPQRPAPAPRQQGR
ncbi:MAG: biopolymer transporter ExbD [Acetobacteraceae bacterium]|jgi:biopolymer transport protein TolR|nr:biopolymer transporter ExbD [Acetobacteraceae bacterium]